MNLAMLLAASPTELHLEGGPTDGSYRLAEDLIARHGASPRPTAILTLEGGSVSVERADQAAESLEGAALGPVYRRVPGGGVAVPTGRALVRFGDKERAENHRDELAAAGYELEQTLGYAPQAGWVRARSGEVADTLRDLERLRRLGNVESVEPQFLSESSRRASNTDPGLS